MGEAHDVAVDDPHLKACCRCLSGLLVGGRYVPVVRRLAILGACIGTANVRAGHSGAAVNLDFVVPRRIDARQRIVSDVTVRVQALTVSRIADDWIDLQEAAELVVIHPSAHMDELHIIRMIVLDEPVDRLRQIQLPIRGIRHVSFAHLPERIVHRVRRAAAPAQALRLARRRIVAVVARDDARILLAGDVAPCVLALRRPVHVAGARVAQRVELAVAGVGVFHAQGRTAGRQRREVCVSTLPALS